MVSAMSSENWIQNRIELAPAKPNVPAKEGSSGGFSRRPRPHHTGAGALGCWYAST